LDGCNGTSYQPHFLLPFPAFLLITAPHSLSSCPLSPCTSVQTQEQHQLITVELRATVGQCLLTAE
jgi:hypothetical protein